MADFKLQLRKGATSNIFQIFIKDSSVTTGAGLTGLVFNTASLVAYYHRDTDVAATQITLVTMTSGTFTSGGFKEIDATNMPGYYQFCPPDAAVASGNLGSVIHLKGAASMQPYPMEISYLGYDPTTLPTVNLTQIDGQTTIGTNATLNLKKLNIVNNAGDALVASSTGSNGNGINTSGNGTGAGLLATGGSTGPGLEGIGGTNAHGLYGVGGGSGSGITGVGGTTGNGALLNGGNTSGNGILAQGITSGSGIYLVAQGSGTHGLFSSGGTNGSGATFNGSGTGQGIQATGGITGNGIIANGGATSGAGIYATGVGSGTGMTLVGVGTNSLIAGQGISGPLDSGERNNIADALLKRDMSVVTGEASRSPLNCFRLLRNKISTSSNTITVTKEDNVTAAWTSTITTNPTAPPIVSFQGN